MKRHTQPLDQFCVRSNSNIVEPNDPADVPRDDV